MVAKVVTTKEKSKRYKANNNACFCCCFFRFKKTLNNGWELASDWAYSLVEIRKSCNSAHFISLHLNWYLKLICQRIKWLKSWRFEREPFVLANQGNCAVCMVFVYMYRKLKRGVTPLKRQHCKVIRIPKNKLVQWEPFSTFYWERQQIDQIAIF